MSSRYTIHFAPGPNPTFLLFALARRRPSLMALPPKPLTCASAPSLAVSEDDVASFVMGLDLPAEAEARLLKLTPATYTGLAAELVRWWDR